MIDIRTAAAMSACETIGADDTAFRDDLDWFAEHSDRIFRSRRPLIEEMRRADILGEDMARIRVIVCRNQEIPKPNGILFVRGAVQLAEGDEEEDLLDDDQSLADVFVAIMRRGQNRMTN